MPEPSDRAWDLFFEVFEALPRQGPGNRASAAKALAMCRGLGPAPAIIDLGCGVGAQTFHLAELTSGTIDAIDSQAAFVASIQARAAERGLSDRVRARVADMADPGFPPGSFDLAWSEGALYCIGLRKALGVCHGLLRPGGFLVFTDAVWRKSDPPAEVKALFDAECPTMGPVESDLALLRDCGFEVIGHFALPDEAWWDDFYGPMESRIAELRVKYADDAEATGILEQIAAEPAMHRRHADCYGYEFFVARRQPDHQPRN